MNETGTAAVATTAPKPPKPRLRGVSHLVAACIAIPATIALGVHARGGSTTAASVVYGLSLILLLGTSAVYHTPMWTQRIRMVLRRLDHSMIFLLIAGTYTPLCIILGGGAATILLPLVWVGAAAGVLMTLFWLHRPRFLTALPYLLLGWAVVPYVFDIYAAIGAVGSGLIAIGGLFYTVGALMYAGRWPHLSPRIFGYHEVFHLLVIAAAACHYAAVWRSVG